MLRRPASALCLAGAGGPGPPSFLTCPGGVLVCPGGVVASPASFFACPGGVFASPGEVAETGDWRVAAAGVCVSGGVGLRGTVTAGGAVDESDPCFGRPAPTPDVRCTVTGVVRTIGVATAPVGWAAVLAETWWLAFGTEGA